MENLKKTMTRPTDTPKTFQKVWPFKISTMTTNCSQPVWVYAKGWVDFYKFTLAGKYGKVVPQ